MANLKEVRTRITSVNSTKQITSAMKMVSASKLRRAQRAILKMRPYALKLGDLLKDILSSMDSNFESPYAEVREAKNVLLIVIASNRGMCGVFNANIIKKAQYHIDNKYNKQNNNNNLSIISIGKKASEYFQRGDYNLVGIYDDLFNDLNFENTVKICNEIMKDFLDKKYDKVEIVYNHFKNAAVQELISEQFLPLEKNGESEENEDNTSYILQPTKEEIIESIIPKTLKITFYKALLESAASEHGARMIAMHKATENATELIKDLRLSYNKARQAAITTEILEIVSGAEALKG